MKAWLHNAHISLYNTLLLNDFSSLVLLLKSQQEIRPTSTNVRSKLSKAVKAAEMERLFRGILHKLVQIILVNSASNSNG